MTSEDRDTQGDREALAELLEGHVFSKAVARCACGLELGGTGHRTKAWRAHVADLLAAHVARARAEALREAADQCERDADDGHCGSAACAANNRITAHWLRDRADRIDSGADQ